MSEDKKPVGRPRRGRYPAVQTVIYLQVESLARIDQERGDVSRSEWVNDAIREKLTRLDIARTTTRPEPYTEPYMEEAPQ